MKTRRPPHLLLALALTACVGKGSDTGETAAETTAATDTTGTTSDSTSDSTTTGSTSDSTSTEGTTGTTTAADPELYCAMFKTPEECNGQWVSESMPCSWRAFVQAKRVGDVCMNTTVEMCRADIGATTDAGCGEGFPGCADFVGVPYYHELDDETVLLVQQCGGSPPVGFSACPSGTAVDAMPPECACICELLP